MAPPEKPKGRAPFANPIVTKPPPPPPVVTRTPSPAPSRPSSPVATLAAIQGGSGPAKGTGGLAKQSEIAAAQKKADDRFNQIQAVKKSQQKVEDMRSANNRDRQYQTSVQKTAISRAEALRQDKAPGPKAPLGIGQYRPMLPTSSNTGTGTRTGTGRTGNQFGGGGNTGKGQYDPLKGYFDPTTPIKPGPGTWTRPDPQVDPDVIPITEYRGGGGGGEGGYNAPPPSPVLIPGRDALNFSTTGTVNSLTSFIFEELGGTELITLMKRDTIDGIDPDYTVISNISEVRRNMDPVSLVSKRTRTESYFDRFAIELLDKIPDDQYLSINNLQDFYYIASNGDLIIELENITASERIDVDIATSGTINELDTD